ADEADRLGVPGELLAGDLLPDLVHARAFEAAVPAAALDDAAQHLAERRRLGTLRRQLRLVRGHRPSPAATATGSVVTEPRRTRCRGPASGTSSSTAAVTITCSKAAQRAASRSRRL